MFIAGIHSVRSAGGKGTSLPTWPLWLAYPTPPLLSKAIPAMEDGGGGSLLH